MMTAMGYPTYYPDVSSDYILPHCSVFLGLQLPLIEDSFKAKRRRQWETITTLSTLLTLNRWLSNIFFSFAKRRRRTAMSAAVYYY